MSDFDLFPLNLPPIVAQVQQVLPAALPAWLVGGALRDAILRRVVHDLDFVVDGDALASARTTANALGGAYYPLDSERGVGRILLTRGDERYTLDFARLRGADLASDLAARDFTINAIAADLSRLAALIDPMNGQRDLRAKVIRTCRPTSIADDPVRGIRAVRFAAQFRFRLDRRTLAEVRGQASALASVSAERRRDEFMRCLAGPRPAAALRSLQVLGLLPFVIPELTSLKGLGQSAPHEYDVWEHTLATVTRLADILKVLNPVYDVDTASDLTLGLVSLRLGRHRHSLGRHLAMPVSGERSAHSLLVLAALLHDIGKPLTRLVEPGGAIRFFNHERAGAGLVQQRLNELRFSSDEIKRVSTVVANHLRPRQLATGPELTHRAIFRFFRQTGEAGIDVILLSLADFLGKYSGGPPPVEPWNKLLDVGVALLQAYFEHPLETVNPPAILTGDDLMGIFGLPAGPQLGSLLMELREAQAAGEVRSREGALEWVRAQLAGGVE
jgi:putative nucleotidyltransferase with HDIG domain